MGWASSSKTALPNKNTLWTSDKKQYKNAVRQFAIETLPDETVSAPYAMNPNNLPFQKI